VRCLRNVHPRPQTAESHGGAQRSRDVAPAPRPRALGAPLRLRGTWPAPSSVQIALARMTSRVWFAVDLVVAIVALAIVTGARRCPRSAAPGDGARAVPAIEPHQEPELTECPKQAATLARKLCEAEGR